MKPWIIAAIAAAGVAVVCAVTKPWNWGKKNKNNEAATAPAEEAKPAEQPKPAEPEKPVEQPAEPAKPAEGTEKPNKEDK